MPQKLTQEQFEQRVKEVDPSFTVVGKYEGYYYPNGKPRKILLRHECEYEDEFLIPNFMHHRCKCRKCNNLIPMTHEEFVAKIALINPNIEIIGKFKGVTKKIKCRCKICEHVWSTDAQVLYKHGCPVCAGVIKTPEIFYREVEEKFPNQYEFLTEYKGIHEDITVRNKFCMHEFTSKAANIFNGDCKCPYCNGKKVLIGFNDLWTTHPHIAKMLKNQEDGYRYTAGSNKRLEWECRDCGTTYKKVVSDVVNNGLRCTLCSDGFPIGEKIVYALLKHINVDFEYQKIFDWLDDRKYDFYLKNYNMIIEVNGIQHYKESRSFTHTSLAEIQENDRYKYKMAKENDIEKYIYIDSSSSNFLTIKENILNSELSHILQLNSLTDDDWINIAKKSVKSFLVICTNLWNEGWCVNQIRDELKIRDDTVRRYLMTANCLKMCDYNTSEARSRWREYDRKCKK